MIRPMPPESPIRPLHILMPSILELNTDSGVIKYLQTLRHELEREGHVVRVVTPWMAPRLLRKSFNLLHRVALVNTALFLFTGRLICWLYLIVACRRQSREPWDVVHAQDPLAASAAKAALPRVPVIMTAHYSADPVDEAFKWSRWPNYRYGRQRLWRRWNRAMFRSIDHVVAISEFSADLTRRLAGREIPCSIIHHGLDPALFATAQPAGDIAQRYAGRFLLLNIGRLEPLKNQRFLLDVIAGLRGTPAQLLLIGKGPDEQFLRDEIARRGLQDYVSLLGYRSDIPAVLKAGHLYVHASSLESFGLVITEAMAAGLPVLACDAGGVRDQFVGVEEALYAPDSTPAIVAGKIHALMQQPGVRHALALRQRDNFQQNFTLDNMLQRTVACYRQMLAQH